MNKVLLQFWVESKEDSIQRDGCSIHLRQCDRFEFLNGVYSKRVGLPVPACYEMVLGQPFVAFVEDGLYEIVSKTGSLRIEEPSLRNLIAMDEITIKNEL